MGERGEKERGGEGRKVGERSYQFARPVATFGQDQNVVERINLKI
jgi:hypothetical protein